MSLHTRPVSVRLGAAMIALVACGDAGGRDDAASVSSSVGSISLSASSTASDTTSDDSVTTNDTTADTVDDPMSCTLDSECPDGQECAPFSGVCVPEGGCVLADDCEGGFVCEDGVCVIGGDCGDFQFQIENVPPNVMILLDRSGSMDGSVPDTDLNRWEVAVQVVDTVTTAFDSTINFGLATYSSCVGGGCSAGTIVVPILPLNAANIQGFLDTTAGEGSSDGMQQGPNGTRYLCDSGDPETSTGVSLQGLVGETTLQDPERSNAVLLITDGGESGECTDDVDGPGGAAALFGQTVPVLTFAVGFGDAVGEQLEEIAIAGGTEHGLPADDPASLQMALETALQTVASCTFALDQVPEDLSEVYVFFDLDPAGVPMDPINGWTYDPATNSVTFHGTACDAIKAGTVVDIDMVYGCNMPPAG